MVDYALALKCARLSQEVYRAFNNELTFETLPQAVITLLEGHSKEHDTEVAVLHDAEEEAVFVVFRGSESSTDWITNVLFRQQVYPYGDGNSEVKFHRGFMDAYFAVREQLQEVVRGLSSQRIIATGHSLGGALATVAALDLQYNVTSQSNQEISVYSYGSPRVGNRALTESFRGRVPQSYRFVYGRDLITHLPRVWMGYAHVPQEQPLGALALRWNIFSRGVQDHAIANYITALEEKQS
ncbi:uncharacterized protein XM38_020330 [Halomicronema hongdechloris C2206]|uniref:Fungal lipase-type domain-containing protein n=1 Tax=Halomicronema hongdechloris C2206 TaxID=1641165 RepID=A0A1Z3HLA2_9CYAN|nr:lipase family protein [Halomicronema hongdechloris]ASC71083.1 uncharacterized protein XM38_020330 [Halomicronema hongdechloris C2206]